MNRPLLSALLLALAVVVSACPMADDSQSAGASVAASVAPSAAEVESEVAEPSAVASAEESVAAGGESTLANDLEPGDCFNTDGSQVDEVSVVDCEGPHVYEAFYKYDLEGGSDAEYPTDEGVLEDAEAECRTAFQEYVGTAYDESALFITVIRPSETTWTEGDRTVICALNEEDETEMTGSAEGSEQ
jgi:hypothetical protein